MRYNIISMGLFKPNFKPPEYCEGATENRANSGYSFKYVRCPNEGEGCIELSWTLCGVELPLGIGAQVVKCAHGFCDSSAPVEGWSEVTDPPPED
ncbi:MAG TPA: hypothetical protein VMR18_03605 [Candidatus Saccharimonadales bacterium]|jgi:hypothetical protein|nr:hypothetical protein [Candidatus Saccharimonadales bacterium]